MQQQTLFGREPELRTLFQLNDRCGEEGARTVFVTGETGIGKTWLVEAFLRRLEAAEKDDDKVLVLRARASEQFGASEPYLPFLELLRQALGRDAELPETSIAGLVQRVAPFWLAAVPVAGSLLSAAYETVKEWGDRRGGTTSLRAPGRDALFFQYTELLRELGRDVRVVAFLDDLHWADASSIGLLFHLARTLEAAPVLFIGTYRPTEVEISDHPIREVKLELERYGLATELALEALDEEAGRKILGREATAAPDATTHLDAMAAGLLRIAGGNPLFLEELARWSVEHRQAGEKQLLEALARAGPDAPRRLLSVLEKRLDALPSGACRVLETASAAGVGFTGAVVADASGVDELELEETLDQIARSHGLIRRIGEAMLPTGDLTTEYQFAHPLAHACLRARLVGRKGGEIHRRMATAIEKCYRGDSSVTGILAQLYRKARDPDRVRDYAARAARRSEEMFAFPEAARFLVMALEAGPRPRERLELLVAKGRVLTPLARYAEAMEALEAAATLARELGQSAPELEARRLLGRCRFASGERSPREIARDMDTLIEEAEQLGDKRELCAILDSAGVAYERAGLARRLREVSRRQLELADELRDDALRAPALFRAARNEVFYGDPERAETLALEAEEAYARLGHLSRRAESMNILAIVANRMGQSDDAVQIWKRAADEFDRLVIPERAVGMRGNIAEALTCLGRFAEASATLEEALDQAADLGRPHIWLFLQTSLVALRVYEGRWNDAVTELDSLRTRVEGHWMYDIQTTAYALLASLALADEQRAHAEGRRLRKLLEGSEQRYFERRAECDLALSRLATLEGRQDEARRILERSLQILSSRDTHPRLLLEFELARHENDERSARQLRRRARDAMRALGIERPPAFVEQT